MVLLVVSRRLEQPQPLQDGDDGAVFRLRAVTPLVQLVGVGTQHGRHYTIGLSRPRLQATTSAAAQAHSSNSELANHELSTNDRGLK